MNCTSVGTTVVIFSAEVVVVFAVVTVGFIVVTEILSLDVSVEATIGSTLGSLFTSFTSFVVEGFSFFFLLPILIMVAVDTVDGVVVFSVDIVIFLMFINK